VAALGKEAVVVIPTTTELEKGLARRLDG